MYVYFIAGGGLTKIGLSWNPERRLADIQASSPLPVRLLRSIEGNRYTETVLHSFFSERRAHGEWFEGEFTDDDLDLAEKVARAHQRQPRTQAPTEVPVNGRCRECGERAARTAKGFCGYECANRWNGKRRRGLAP